MPICSPLGWCTVTPPSTPGTIRFLMRTFANAPRSMTSWLQRRAPKVFISRALCSLQPLAGGRSRLDRRDRADVVGRERIAVDAERTRAFHVVHGPRLEIDAFEERRLEDVGRLRDRSRTSRLCFRGSRPTALSRPRGRRIRAGISRRRSRTGAPRRSRRRSARCLSGTPACRPLPVPIGSLSVSMRTVPASANATTSGGLMRKLAFRLWCTRASKLRLPESTAHATTSFLTTASSIASSSGPALPMQVVQP